MFSFFKKKVKEQKDIQHKIETVLCIPGFWKNRDEVLHAIPLNNNFEYIFAGVVLMNTKTNEGVQLFVEPKNEALREKFEWSGLVNGISEDFLNEINKHEHIVYLVADTGSFESAKSLAFAASAILKAGGIGVNVESAGKGFTKDQWMELVETFEEYNLYEMFVHDSIEDNNGNLFSCGMHNLGLKDAIIYNEDPYLANQALRVWGTYQILDKPSVKKGQTFSIAPNSPIFRIEEENSPPYKKLDLLHNPLGMWKIIKINS